MQGEQFLVQLANIQGTPEALLTSQIGREISAAAYGSLDKRRLAAAGIRLANVYAATSQQIDEGADLYEKVGVFGQDMNRFSAGSGMSWEEIMAFEKKNNVQTIGMADSHYKQAENLQRQLVGYQERTKEAMDNLRSAPGAKQALGSLAILNGTLVEQLSGLIAVTAAREKREAKALGEAGQSEEEARRAREEARIRNESVSNFFGGSK